MISSVENPAAFVGQDRVWRQLRTTPASSELRPILFLDRDGVVVEEVNYLHRIEDVRFVDGVAKTIVAFRQSGWLVAVVTNQAGIGHGYYGWDEFAAVNEFILNWLDHRGAVLDAVLSVPHHPEGLGVYRHPNHPMRKPNPGMLLTAAEMLNGDLTKSLIVGDNAADLLAGQRAGLRQGFAVLTGHGPRYRVASEALASPRFAVNVVANAGDPGLLRVLKANCGVD